SCENNADSAELINMFYKIYYIKIITVGKTRKALISHAFRVFDEPCDSQAASRPASSRAFAL
ncbi:MAG: hypothetical protein IIY28_09930, partial [Lachnospiraceae bacterium]|nr:hypothetical protein [Lachnospiraceae bacterium]